LRSFVCTEILILAVYNSKLYMGDITVHIVIFSN